MTPTTYGECVALVDTILDELGTELVVGTPLGIGKPNHILNELVERALENPEIELEIWTALTLSKPDPDSELERRLIEPLSERIFGTYPNLTYAELLSEQALPDNIEVNEFYFQPGEYMWNPTAQQSHRNVNYTHALRAFRDAEPDLLLQLVGKGEIDGDVQYNIASNTDITTELIESMRNASGRKTMIVGEVTSEMPFMFGDAPVSPEKFDAVLNDQRNLDLFAPPNEPVSDADQAIGLRVSSLLKDGGTLQIGIGSLGDAIGWATELRHHENDAYRDAVTALDVQTQSQELVEELGGFDPFEEGLYGATEMFVEAFLQLYKADILKREVYDDPTIQQLDNAGHFDDGVTLETVDRLRSEGAISEHLTEEDCAYLKRWGIFHSTVEYEDGHLRADGESIPVDLGDPDARVAIAEHALRTDLSGGRVLHGGFFIGSTDFYEGLREMSERRRRKLAMTSVQFTNALYGEEELKRAQRQDARFVNTGMKATATGGVASDGTADGQVVSGVGGQFNFVNQAHELDDGRSIIMIRSTRGSGDSLESNVVWNYGHITIPRHLRDIVVTEYGIADLRGKSDADVIAKMIKIADSRFQDELIDKAKSAGKLPAEWELPEQYRQNYPEKIEDALAPFRTDGTLPQFPYGTDLTEEERHLAQSLRNLQSKLGSDGLAKVPALDSLKKTLFVPAAAKPYLERMGLASQSTPREFAYRRAVVLALAESDFL